MTSRTPTPHLTEAMREAAHAYAARLMRQGLSSSDAWTKAKALARQNLLTADGRLKPVKREKAKAQRPSS